MFQTYETVNRVCDKKKIEKMFLDKISCEVKIHFDKLSKDEIFNDPEQRFRVIIINPIIDIIIISDEN